MFQVARNKIRVVDVRGIPLRYLGKNPLLLAKKAVAKVDFLVLYRWADLFVMGIHSDMEFRRWYGVPERKLLHVPTTIRMPDLSQPVEPPPRRCFPRTVPRPLRYLAVAAIFWAAGVASVCGGGGDNSTVTTDQLALMVDPLTIPHLDFDTDGDGIVDYRIVGDWDGDGLLTWDDIQAAVDDLCGPNHNGVQDALFCGTIRIPRGAWRSRATLDADRGDTTDDQINLRNYRGLRLIGAGVDNTVLRTEYSRQDFCRTHGTIGGGGVVSRESPGDLEIAGFTFVGLPPRTWGKLDCDGDGLDAGDPRETDYAGRTLQSAIVVFSASGVVSDNVTIRDIVVEQVDYLAFSLGAIRHLDARRLVSSAAGAGGFLLAGISDSTGVDLLSEGCFASFPCAGFSVYANLKEVLLPEPPQVRNLRLDNVTSLGSHIGIHLAAFGAGGISGVTVRNLEATNPRPVGPGVTAFNQFGIYFQDNGCVSDPAGAAEPCYIRDVVLDNGVVEGFGGYGFTAFPQGGGPSRQYVLRNLLFRDNGIGIGTTDARNVTLAGIPGTVFERNTVVGGDRDGNGIPDLTHLLRAESDDLVVRDNLFTGSVAPPVPAFLYITGGDNVSVTGNVFESAALPGVAPWKLGPAVTNEDVSGNVVR